MTSSLGGNYYPPVMNGSQYKKGLGRRSDKNRHLMFVLFLKVVVAALVGRLIVL